MYCVCSALDLSLYLPHLALPFVLGFIFQVPILLLLVRIFVIVSLSNTIQHCIEFHNFCPFCIYLTCFSSVLASFTICEASERMEHLHAIIFHCVRVCHTHFWKAILLLYILYISSPSPSFCDNNIHPHDWDNREPIPKFHKTNAYFHLVARQWLLVQFGLFATPAFCPHSNKSSHTHTHTRTELCASRTFRFFVVLLPLLLLLLFI